MVIAENNVAKEWAKPMVRAFATWRPVLASGVATFDPLASRVHGAVTANRILFSCRYEIAGVRHEADDHLTVIVTVVRVRYSIPGHVCDTNLEALVHPKTFVDDAI